MIVGVIVWVKSIELELFDCNWCFCCVCKEVVFDDYDVVYDLDEDFSLFLCKFSMLCVVVEFDLCFVLVIVDCMLVLFVVKFKVC